MAPKAVELFHVLGILNGPVVDFVFRRLGKPKQGGWYEANKQFIAPLPIPNVPPDARKKVASLAKRLQEGRTRWRDLLSEAEDRLGVLGRARRSARWLWPNLPELSQLIDRAPKNLRLAPDKRGWAETRLEELEATRLETLQAALDRGGRFEAVFDKGELRLYAAGTAVLDRIYLEEAAGRLTEAYWRFLLLSGPPREAGRFASELRRPPAEPGSPAAAQFMERVAALTEETAAIDADESAMNELLYELYNLSPAERNLVENERQRRNAPTAAA